MPRKPGPEGKRERYQVVAPPRVAERVKDLAIREDRSISNMLLVLVQKGLDAIDAEQQPAAAR